MCGQLFSCFVWACIGARACSQQQAQTNYFLELYIIQYIHVLNESRPLGSLIHANQNNSKCTHSCLNIQTLPAYDSHDWIIEVNIQQFIVNSAHHCSFSSHSCQSVRCPFYSIKNNLFHLYQVRIEISISKLAQKCAGRNDL